MGSVDPQGDEIPAVDVAQGLRAFLGLEEEQGSLQGAPSALEICGDRGSVALGWAHPGCPPVLPKLTLFALPGPRELRGGRGSVQVPAVSHRLGDLVVDTLGTRVLRAGAPCGTRH